MSSAAEDIGELWSSQESKTAEFDYSRYDSIPWMLAKTSLALGMITAAYLLYALHELPWSLFGSAAGILVLAMTPFFAGLILGFSFENPKAALIYSIVIGFASIGLCMALMLLPKHMGLAEYGPGVMKNVWFYGFFIPFIMTISFVPAGAMVSSSTNVYE